MTSSQLEHLLVRIKKLRGEIRKAETVQIGKRLLLTEAHSISTLWFQEVLTPLQALGLQAPEVIDSQDQFSKTT
jgi:hypothetical protein